MQCDSCGLHTDRLREYSRVIDLGKYRKTIETVQLCAACRVMNALNPRYVARRVDEHHAIPFAMLSGAPAERQRPSSPL
ncbi:MAG TPA: hypothetical protein VF132_08350 [Rudaea sp.]